MALNRNPVVISLSAQIRIFGLVSNALVEMVNMLVVVFALKWNVNWSVKFDTDDSWKQINTGGLFVALNSNLSMNKKKLERVVMLMANVVKAEQNKNFDLINLLFAQTVQGEIQEVKIAW